MAKSACIIIPGGPGLRSDYMLPWARHATSGRAVKIAALEYSAFAGPNPESSLRRAAAWIRRRARGGPIMLLAHSFGARLAIELLRRDPNLAYTAVLMNCPATQATSVRFKRRKRKLRLPTTIETEADFRRYWRAVLPLYFHSPPTSKTVAMLTHGTTWLKSARLGASFSDRIRSLPRQTQRVLTFVNGQEDARFPKGNAATLRSLFPASRHIAVSRCGHFPMLEMPFILRGVDAGKPVALIDHIPDADSGERWVWRRPAK